MQTPYPTFVRTKQPSGFVGISTFTSTRPSGSVVSVTVALPVQGWFSVLVAAAVQDDGNMSGECSTTKEVPWGRVAARVKV